jgi:hypothetical protein
LQGAAQGDEVRQSIRAAHDAKVSNLLRRNTLQMGGSASGVVYFEGPKGMKNTKKGFTPVAHLDIPVNFRVKPSVFLSFRFRFVIQLVAVFGNPR